MKFLISFPQTTAEYAKYRLAKLMQGVVEGSNDVFRGDAGGELALYQQAEPFARIEQLAALRIDHPYGLSYVEDEGLYVTVGDPCSADGEPTDQRIVRLDPRGRIDLEVRSPYFSDLRSVRRTARGLLVASGGNDAVFEVDFSGRVLWQWWGIDHGFDKLPNGAPRVLDKESDHRAKCYPTSQKATHLNGVIEDPHDRGRLLASLFQQNCVIAIDRATLQHEVVLGGLHRQHHLRGLPDGYTLADTRRGTLLVCDRNFAVKARIKAAEQAAQAVLEWMQDGLLTPFGTYLLGDAGRFSLVETDGAGRRQDFRIGAQKRLFQIELVPDSFYLPSVQSRTRE